MNDNSQVLFIFPHSRGPIADDRPDTEAGGQLPHQAGQPGGGQGGVHGHCQPIYPRQPAADGHVPR